MMHCCPISGYSIIKSADYYYNQYYSADIGASRPLSHATTQSKTRSDANAHRNNDNVDDDDDAGAHGMKTRDRAALDGMINTKQSHSQRRCAYRG
jgi:hypothetical protein